MIERIHKQAAPELVEAVKSGVISISAAAAVAALPEEEQRAAAAAGKDELKQAAKRVREAKRKPRKPVQEVLPSADGELEIDPSREAEIAEALASLGEGPAELRQRVIALTLENDAARAVGGTSPTGRRSGVIRPIRDGCRGGVRVRVDTLAA